MANPKLKHGTIGCPCQCGDNPDCGPMVICVGVSVRCGYDGTFAGTMTVTPPAPPPGYDPAAPETVDLAAGGSACYRPPYPGDYHLDFSVPGYVGMPESADVTVACGQSRTLSYALLPDDDADEPYPCEDWVYSGCCGCSPRGRRPDRIPRTLYLTLDGPAEFLGGLAGTTLTLPFVGDYDFCPSPTAYPRTFTQRWQLVMGGQVDYACYTGVGCALPSPDCDHVLPDSASKLVERHTYDRTTVTVSTTNRVVDEFGNTACASFVSVVHERLSPANPCPQLDPTNPFNKKQTLARGLPYETCDDPCPCNESYGAAIQHPEDFPPGPWHRTFYPSSWSTPIGDPMPRPGDRLACGPVNYTQTAIILMDSLPKCPDPYRSSPSITATLTE